MIIEEITVTSFQQHTRIIGCEDTKQAICIDPGDEAERIVESLERRGLTLQAIALTHAHLDHVGGVAALKKLQPKEKICLNNGDEFYPSMLEAVESAETSITIEAYIYWAETIGWQFAKALADRARQGVSVKILLDAIGSASIGEKLLSHWWLCGSTSDL